ncbi:MAG: hypothetical protein OEU68_06235 [Nitrospira sp.]|nr:hypothetical protein [Nitrospira sp.]MDH4243743.1 hypothetical protein [Nitrospira sp.]MDH4357313.1 hypothetical protein [Nitrospira sp.]MDH5317755.1 hypothetical protein [Nitrospira sp.]
MRRGGHISGIALVVAMLGNVSGVLAYEIGEVTSGGTISGKITFQGAAPSPKLFPVNKDPEVCGAERTVNEVVVRNGLLQGAVVILEGVKAGKPFIASGYRGEPPGEGEFRYGGGEDISLEILTKGCNFGPFTGVLTLDQPVRFLNQDPIKHILHSVSSRDDKGLILRTIHNRELRPDTSAEQTFYSSKLKRDRVVGIHCNRHDFMQSWLYVVTSPYYSLSDQEGTFTIDQVPPGQYELLAWHPALGLKRHEVQVTEGGEIEASFEFVGK